MHGARDGELSSTTLVSERSTGVPARGRQLSRGGGVRLLWQLEHRVSSRERADAGLLSSYRALWRWAFLKQQSALLL